MKISNDVIGLVAGILTATSMLPQIIKTVKEKKAAEISPIMIMTLIAGTGLWLYYGTLKDDLPIIVTNAFSCFLNCLMLFFRFRYKEK